MTSAALNLDFDRNRFFHRLPKSELISRGDRGPKVSEYSFWYDLIWIFEKDTPGQSNFEGKFNFKILLRAETKEYVAEYLTDASHHQLLDEVRRFLWSRMEDGARAQIVKRGSINQYRVEIALFLRWLVSVGYESFGDVPPGAVMSSFLPFLVSEKARSNDDSEHTVDALRAYLQLPARLFEQNSVMPSGVSLLRHDPFPGTSPQKQASELSTKVARQIPAVPSAIFAAATGAMLTWLDHIIPDILQFQNVFLDKDGPHGARGTDHTKKNRVRDEVISQRLLSEDFACLPGENSAWRKRLVFNSIRHNSVGHQLRSIVTDGVSACVLTILALVGMRLSEVCGLLCGPPDRITGLPECVEIEPTLNGLFEAFYISGHIYKKRRVPQRHRWAAGLRPVGSSELPPAVLAIQRLHQLLEPWRKLARVDDPATDDTLHKQLLVRFAFAREFPRGRDGIALVKATHLAKQMKSWLRRYGHVPNDVNITTPAWRKSYALQTYMIDPQLLPGISKHYGHVSEMITFSSYVAGADPDLERYRDDVAYNEVARYMTAIRRGDIATVGKISEAIFGNREALDAHFASVPEDEIIEAMISELRRSQIRSFGAPWGICIFRQEWSRCEGSACGPNFAKRNTDTCCACANLVVLDRHLDFWRERRSKTEKSLAEFELFDPSAGIVHVLRSRLAQSEKVLIALKAAA